MMSNLQQGPGFPNTRKGRGFAVTVFISGIVALIGLCLGFSDAEVQWLFEIFKVLDVSVTVS
jgi:hypothetical protein